jgi:hypothetical protein
MGEEGSTQQRCKRCDKLLSPQAELWAGHYCTDCVFALKEIVDSTPPVDRDALGIFLQGWGLPPTTPLTFVYSPGEAFFKKKLPGYRAETVCAPWTGWTTTSPWKFRLPASFVADEFARTEKETDHWPQGFPKVDILGKPLPEEDHDLLVEVRFRIWRPGTQGFAETRWDPVERRSRIDLRDLDDESVCSPRKLSVFLDAICDHNKPGPKLGSIIYPDRDAFLAQCAQGIQVISERERDLRGAKTKLASELGIDPKTLTNHLRSHGLPSQWNAFLAYLLTYQDQYGNS